MGMNEGTKGHATEYDGKLIRRRVTFFISIAKAEAEKTRDN